MHYLIIGSGGTGGLLGGFLAASGKQVTMIARGAHLDAMRQNGLKLHSTPRGELHITNLQATSSQEYTGIADVIFVCVKEYSLDSIFEMIEKASDAHTLIIPILNTSGTGDRIATALPSDRAVLDGCIYLSGYINAPGEITQNGPLFSLIFGARSGTDSAPEALLKALEAELVECGIDAKISHQIKNDTFRKYSFISPFAAAGTYYNLPASGLQEQGEARDLFIALSHEIAAVATAQGLTFDFDLATEALKRIDSMPPATTSSMHKDILKGGGSEVDGLVFDIIRVGEKLGVELPAYRKVAEKLESAR